MKTKFNFRFLVALFVGIFMSVNVYAQDINVSGTVIDDFGEPVLGANVVVKGTTIGATTDLDGNYSLKAPKGSTLIVSFIGYKSQEVIVEKETINFNLKEDSELLEDVVVIGYGSVKKNDLTGSVVAIKAEEVNRGAVTSPDQMLKGKVPGLLVTPASGDPTEGATIRLRGAASLYASNDPLIVIDGVPVTSEGGAGMANPLATVNPNDIESYTVLKDASATAIYGSRASNGVIMITTKKGSGNKVQIAYNGSVSFKQNTATLDVLSSQEYLDLISTSYAGTERAEAVAKLAGNANTDWQSKIYRTAVTTDHNVSVFGQAGFLPYRVSVGYTFDQATLKVGDNARTNFSVSLSPSFFDKHLSVNVNNKTINNKATYTAGGAVGSAISFSPTVPETDPNNGISNGYFNWLQSDGSANTMAGVNPLSSLYDRYNKNNSWRTLGNVQLDYKIHGFEALRFNVNAGYDFSRTTGDDYNYLGTISAKRSDGVDQYHYYASQNSNSLLEAYADFNKEFGQHNLDVMAGYSWQHNYVKYNNEYYINSQAIQDDFDTESQKESNIYQINPTDRREYYIVSFYGRLNYNFAHKYYLTYTLRNDGSSRFSEDNRWGLFQSGALSWNLGEEDFIKDIDAISSLKLRLGVGQTGQQDIGMDRCYSYQAKYTTSSDIRMRMPFGGQSFIYTLAPNAYNKDIKWETCTTYNAGIDFGFINGRINGNVDVYLRKTTDLLNEVPTPLGNNFSNTVIANVGDMENKGVEFNLNLIPIEQRDLRWTINFNGTFQNINVTKLTNTPTPDYIGVQTGQSMGSNEGFTSLYRVGYTPWTYYLYQQAYDENGKAIENVFVDRNGDGEITPDDRYVTGKSYQPKFFYGLSSELTWKNWNLGFNAHGSIGGYALNKVAKGNATAFSEDWTKGYISNLTTYVKETGWTAAMSDYQSYSDMFIENASFFRLDDINLGYTFDKIGNWKGSVRLGASVQNVFTITNYSGLDPELTSSDGVDNNIIPRPRLYTFRVSVNF